MKNQNSINVPAAMPLTMSTLEIAGLCEKRHDNVVRDARKMADGLGLSLIFEEKGGTGGRPLILAHLPKRECLILVSGYSVEMRARIIDRWLQLEAAIAAAPPLGLLDEDARKAFGGIVKSVVHSQLATVLPSMVEAAILADARRAVLDYVSVRQLLNEAKAEQKGRKSLNRRVGYQLGLLAKERGGARKCPHTGVWLYPRVLADEFMRIAGAAMVAAHNDSVHGQGVLKLVPKKRDDSARPL